MSVYNKILHERGLRLLGGIVGLGTLACALCLGPFVHFFNQHVSSTVFKAVVYRRLNRFRAYRNAVASRAELSNCF